MLPRHGFNDVANGTLEISFRTIRRSVLSFSYTQCDINQTLTDL